MESIINQKVDAFVDWHNAHSVAELIEMLKAEHGDSYHTLASKIGVSPSTLHRIKQGGKPDDATLDKIADYVGVARVWLYELAKGISSRPRYSRTVSLIAGLLDQMPSDIQDDFLVQARVRFESLKKRSAKRDQ